MAIFATSDPHYGHANIIKYCKRPFKSVEEMDEAMIRNFNRVVSPDDTTIIAGDFAFYRDQGHTRAIIQRLNGIKRFIKGNHDKYLTDETLACFDSIHDYFELEIPDPTSRKGKRMIVISHYPFMVWNKSHHGSWHLHGHCHGSLPEDKSALRIDLGVDCHNFAPISLDQIADIMKRKTFKPIDKHGAD